MTAPAMSFNTDNGRYYGHPVNKASVPSVTNIKRQKNMPAINGSNIRKVAEYAVDNWDRIKDLTRDEKVSLIKESAYAKNPASRIGDIVHAWVDVWIRTEVHPRDAEPIVLSDGEVVNFQDAPLTARRMWKQYEGFNNHRKPTYTNSEFTVWSYQYGYAGTADFSAVVSDWLVLGDTKTGKGAYPDTGLQLAALACADVIVNPDGTESEMPKYQRCAILHLRPTYHRFIPVANIESCFKAFLGLKASFDHETSFADKVLMSAPKIETDYKGA